MEVQFGPNAVDEPNLLYKLQNKIKVFNTCDSLPKRGYCLVANSSKYGLVFIASPDGTLSVYYLKQLIDKECEPQHVSVKLLDKPTHIAVSCDEELLAVSGDLMLCVYKITDFQNHNPSPSFTLKYPHVTPTFVSALQWNPCIPDTIAIAFFNGSLLMSTVSTAHVRQTQGKARCICWSPKGKQLVTGNSDGTLCQYKPDLTPAKLIPAPNLFEGAPVEALAIYWISTFKFAVVYKNAADNSRPAVTIVNTPKAGQPLCLNYEDICYSLGSDRPWYYYLQALAQWNVVLCSSSNSMEMATLGSADGTNWLQWCQSDEARPELPLTDKKQENYPVGLCIDTCAVHQLPWGENETLPHMPLLHVVSQSGLLTIFNIINLRKDAVAVCTPPQQLVLPAAAMTSDIPNDGQPQPTPPAIPVESKPQPVAQPESPQVAPAAFAPAAQFSSTPINAAAAKPLSFQQPFTTADHGFTAAPVPQTVEQNQHEVKPVLAIPQPQAPAAQIKPPTSAPAPRPQVAPQAQEVNAALKAEVELVKRMKVDLELRNMLVKEVNDFQVELYNFVGKTREVQIKLQHDLDALDSSVRFPQTDPEQLKKECSLEELRGAIVQLKLELVRACAVVAEARTHAEAKHLHEWSQADPLTTKRVASVKNLAYYVQTQLEQAHKALDLKWDQLTRDPQLNRPGQRMIRPILDDVYQPLVRQQEILSRQQVVLRTLRNTLNECDATPLFKSTSLLRSTPFRNKDPLSKLTKNILNMSIEPQNNKPNESQLTPQKLDALRDMLSNHKPVKIKPVNVELRQHLAAMRLNYERSVKEKANVEPVQVKKEPGMPSHPTPVNILPQVKAKHAQPALQPAPQFESVKPDIISKPAPISASTFTPVNKPTMPGPSVVRTLFSDEPKHEQQTPPQTIQHIQPTVKPFGFAPPTSTTITASATTRSVLKDLLQNKLASQAKEDVNTLMGLNICSPTAFAFSSVPPSTAQIPTVSFTSKPISDINNMFNKFTPQPFTAEPKAQSSTIKPKSDETGEPEATEPNKPLNMKKNDEKITNLFGLKTTSSPAVNSQNVPDVLKSNTQSLNAIKDIKILSKAVERVAEKSKENIPEESLENVAPANDDKKENGSKVFTEATHKPSMFASTAQPVVTRASPIIASDDHKEPSKAHDENVDEVPKVAEKSDLSVNNSASSIFATANAATPNASKQESIFGKPSSPTSASKISIFGSQTPTPPISPEIETSAKKSLFGAASDSASFIFGKAVASHSESFGKTTESGSTSPSTASVFSSSQGSIFANTTSKPTSPTSIFGTSNSQSVFSGSPLAKPSVFSTSGAASPTSVFGTSPTSVFATTSQSSTEPSSTPDLSTSTTTEASVFGNIATTAGSVLDTPANTSQSAFDTVTATSKPTAFSATTTTQSVFATATPTTQASVFGTTSNQPSIFAENKQTSVFGTTATGAQSSVFGNPTPTTQASVFGSAAPTTQASLFGSAAQTTQASVFGSATPTTEAPLFGGPAQSTPASVFGSASVTTQASLFGSPNQTSPASVFGSQPPTTTQSGSLFGSSESNLFAAASISTTSASSTAGSIFGGGQPTSVFGGSNTNVFGGKAGFGQGNTSATNIFGGGTTFGQKPATDFWAGGNGNASSGGFGTTGFGQQATTQASSIFGSGSSGSFSSPLGGQAFGSPPQSSVFGSPQQQTGSAFGASAAFGSKPAFGQSTGFGTPPSGGFGSFGGFNKSPNSGFGAPASFGGGASFGGSAFGGSSPSKMFGAPAAAPGFGTPTQSNATFENLATQNTLTFGNLAQQTGPPPQPTQTFNTSPSFTGWRG